MDQLPFIIDTVPFENMHYTVWKNEKFSLTEPIIREINAFVNTVKSSLKAAASNIFGGKFSAA